MNKTNGINVVVCVPRPIQHLLRPSLCLVTGRGEYEGGRKKERSCTQFLTVPTPYARCVFIRSFHDENNFPDSRNLVHLKECNPSSVHIIWRGNTHVAAGDTWSALFGERKAP